MRILLNMNTSLVAALQGAVATGRMPFGVSQYQSWNAIGETATRDTVTTLGQLLQRILQKGPIPPSLSSLATRLEQLPNYKVISYNGDGAYEGQVNALGLRHGFGKYTKNDPDAYRTYIGEWERGTAEGYGKMTTKPEIDVSTHVEAEYEGTIQDNCRHGHGKAIYSGGAEYVGQWKANKRHGYGVMSWSPLSRYEGYWFQDKMHGQGI